MHYELMITNILGLLSFMYKLLYVLNTFFLSCVALYAATLVTVILSIIKAPLSLAI